MVRFGDNEESLKTRIWLQIQNGNPDPLEKYQVHDKRKGCTCVWSLVTESVAVTEILASKGWGGKKKNN